VVQNVDFPERQMYLTRNLIGHLYPAACDHTGTVVAPGRCPRSILDCRLRPS
jgi:hypothetical protein